MLRERACVSVNEQPVAPAQDVKPVLNAPVKQDDAPKNEVALPGPPSLYKVYRSAEEIQYAPEDALKEGLGMVKALKASIKKVDLGSKMRHDVWQDEIKKCVLNSWVVGVGWLGDMYRCSCTPSHIACLAKVLQQP